MNKTFKSFLDLPEEDRKEAFVRAAKTDRMETELPKTCSALLIGQEKQYIFLTKQENANNQGALSSARNR